MHVNGGMHIINFILTYRLMLHDATNSNKHHTQLHISSSKVSPLTKHTQKTNWKNYVEIISLVVAIFWLQTISTLQSIQKRMKTVTHFWWKVYLFFITRERTLIMNAIFGPFLTPPPFVRILTAIALPPPFKFCLSKWTSFHLLAVRL